MNSGKISDNKHQIELFIITIFKDNFTSLLATLNSLSRFELNTTIILKNGGRALSKHERIAITRILQDTEFTIHILEKLDSGIYSAMNQALEFVQESLFKHSNVWVWFLNSGDILAKNCLPRRNILESIPQDSHVVLGKPSRGVTLEELQSSFLDMKQFLWGKIVISHQAVLFRSNVFKNFGLYNENMEIISDYILMHQVLSSSRITRINFPYIEHEPGGISQTRLIKQEFEKIIYCFKLLFSDLSRELIMVTIYKIYYLGKHIIKRFLYDNYGSKSLNQEQEKFL